MTATHLDASIDVHASAAPTRSLPAVASSLALYLGSIGEAWRQWQQFRRLDAMSDRKLAEAGLAREQLLQHVLAQRGPARRR